MIDNLTPLKESQSELNEKIKNLPISLTVQDVADFLGIGLTTAYKLVKEPDFPQKKLKGVKRVVIPKIKFIEWYLNDDE